MKLKRRNSKLEVGDEVVAKFLGAPHNCVVIEIVDRHTYKLKTPSGTILPSAKWEDKTAKDRKGAMHRTTEDDGERGGADQAT